MTALAVAVVFTCGWAAVTTGAPKAPKAREAAAEAAPLPPVTEADWTMAGTPDLVSAPDGWTLPASGASKKPADAAGPTGKTAKAKPAKAKPGQAAGAGGGRAGAKPSAPGAAAGAKSPDARPGAAAGPAKGKLRGSIKLLAGQPAQGGNALPPTTRARTGTVVFTGEPAQAVVVSYHKDDLSQGGAGNLRVVAESKLVRNDLRTGAPTGTFAMPPGSDVLAAGGDGTHVLVRLVAKDADAARVDLYKLPARGNGKPQHVAGFAPYAAEQAPEVSWAAVLDEQHVVTRNIGGKLACWKLPECQAVWTADTPAGFDDPAPSPDRKYLAVAMEGGLFVLDARTGDALGKLDWEKAGGTLAWHPDGSRLAAVSGGSVGVWDLAAAGRRLHAFTLPKGSLIEGMAYSGFAWAGDRHLMLNRELLVDLDLGVTVWHYAQPHAPPPVVGQPDARFWTCTDTYGGTLVGLNLPHDEAKKALAGVAGKELLAVAPGSAVSVHVNLPPDAAADRKEAVTKRLSELATQAGFKVVDREQPVRLTLDVRAGAGQQVQYGEGVLGARNLQTVTAPTWDCKLALTADGQEAWSYQRNTGGSHPSSVQLAQGQTIQQYLTESNAKSYDWFLGSLPGIPRQVAKPVTTPGGKPGLGQSTVTASGVVPAGR